MINVGVVGCLGRMGRLIAREVLNVSGAELIGCVTSPGSEYVGSDMGDVIGCGRGVNISDSLEEIFDISDVVIEFSKPECMLECIDLAVKKRKPLVSGTTGIGDIDFQSCVTGVPFLWSANMSMGVNLLLCMIEEVAGCLRDYDVELWELHHRGKRDAPSGTSLMIGRAIAKAMGTEFKLQQYVLGGERRQDGAIGFAVSRGGGSAGEHSVMFIGDGERVELCHRTTNEGIYAKGAVRAALWLVNQPAGVYTMSDVLFGM